MGNIRKKRSLFGIELITGGVQGSYWMSACTMSCFTAIYLDYLGFSNARIGVTSSLIYLFTMVLQIVIANYSDAHFSVPIKYIITAMHVAAIIFAAVVNYLPMPVAVMMFVYSIAQAFSGAIDCFISAMIVQFNNLGLPIRYGWPRSFGSVFYALLAFFLGFAIEKYTAKLLMPLFILLTLLAIGIVLLVPVPKQYAAPDQLALFAGADKKKSVSYRDMLLGNKTLLLLLAALFLSAVGYAPSFMFSIRIFERVGGNSSNVGINSFFSAFMELPALVLSAKLLQKFNCRRLLVFSLFFHVLRLALMMLSGGAVPIYIISCFQGMNNGIYMVSAMNFANEIVGNGEMVRAQSAIAFSKTLGYVAGNALAGAILGWGGVQTMLGIGIGFCLLAAIVLLICVRANERVRSAV